MDTEATGKVDAPTPGQARQQLADLVEGLAVLDVLLEAAEGDQRAGPAVLLLSRDVGRLHDQLRQHGRRLRLLLSRSRRG
jgi:hypothetical protein